MEMSEGDKQRLFTTLGYIKKGVDANTKQIEKQNGNVADLRKMVNRHEVFIGKVGAITAIIAFFASIVFTFLANAWLKFWE